MSRLLEDHARLDGPPDAAWSIVEDAEAVGRVLPGAESVVVMGPGRFRCVLSARLQFLTVRADVDATIHDADPPRRMRLELDGRPRGLAGSFHVSVPIELTPADGPGGAGSQTAVAYAIDLDVTGRLASFGAPLLRDTMRRQIRELIANVDREIATRRAADDRRREP